MIRLFKHYIPNAVFLLGLFDFALLVLAGELGWALRARQIGMDIGQIADRWEPLLLFAVLVQTTMIAVGVYGSDSLRSMRYATARLLVAVSLGIIALSALYFLMPGHGLWRSNLFYAMFLAIALLFAVRLLLGGFLGTAAFRRRVLVLGSGLRADRLRKLGERPEAGFVIVSYVGMSDSTPVVEEAINRNAIHNLTRFVENLGVTEVVLALEERPEFVANLEDEIPYYAERHMVKPGITGWAQINYPYGASIDDARHKLEYDLYYAKNYTPFLDLLILLQTLRVVLWHEGAR